MSSLSIYIHWPFCRSKCPYCDFNSEAVAGIEQDRWRAAYLADLATANGCEGRQVSSVFFGGGTPSLMAPETVAALMEAVAARWPLAADIEVTLEANPGSVTPAEFKALRAAGVNRLSLGVQALDDAGLRSLGRSHDLATALSALEQALVTFPRVSFDLIHTRPGQEPADWRRELVRAAALGTGHLSVYQLTLEPDTPFERRRHRGELLLPDEDAAVAFAEITQEVLEAAGLPAYEISNHARPGEECRHNLTYWRGGDWLGIGPGAHGRLTDAGGTRLALSARRAATDWLAAVESGRGGSLPPEPLTREEQFTERLLMGLRLTAGIDRAALHAEFGRDLTELLDSAPLHRLIDGGFLRLDTHSLAATPAGLQRLDAVLAMLTACPPGK